MRVESGCVFRVSSWIGSVSAGIILAAACSNGVAANCPAVAAHEETPAYLAYSQSHFQRAEDLYGQQVSQHPQDLEAAAWLVRTLLHENEISQAAAAAAKMMAQDPHSAIALTAQAEVQYRQGEPWQALETAKAAVAANPCYARAHLVRSWALRIDSMYASERAEIQSAYEIDPTDPDIRHGWLSIGLPAHEVSSVHEALKTMKDMDEESRQKATASMEEMLPMVFENSETCKVQPSVASATVPLLPAFLDPKHVEAYKLDVQLPQTKAKLTVDTAASGIYISRALAEQNGLKADPNDPPGTVRAESVRIGPLEFHNCLMGVSEAPFGGRTDGFIGTDMFASYLITLDQPGAKLKLDPLPEQADFVPGDRAIPSELSNYSPVYHRRQYLLEPVMLNSKTRKLFILDTGIRFSTMTSEVAHSISTMKVNFTNPIQTVSGSTLHVYRDSFNMQFANLALEHQSHVLEFDPSAVNANAGFEVAGMLGFDMLHSLVLHMDYRDGLVKLESVEGASERGSANAIANVGNDQPMECPRFQDQDFPARSAIRAKVVSTLDSSHLKPGKEVTVKLVEEYRIDKCTLSAGSFLTGHVTATGPSKGSAGSELALVFDHGQCDGHSAGEMTLKVIGLVAPPDQYDALHSALPGEVAGGGRTQAGTQVGYFDDNLNPGGPPHTIHPGIVTGYPKVKLDPVGGPGCSAKFTSTDPNVRVWINSEVLLMMMVTQ